MSQSASWTMPKGWRAVIGLEIHAQLQTQSKLFCTCSTGFGAPENEHVCAIDGGLPGVLPVLNRRAVELAVRAALALRCEIQEHSVWARKHYFYPDLPKGYQISQFDRPFSKNGFINVTTEHGTKKIRVQRVHMEEDAGKSVHEENKTLINLNRAGTPLVEIVSEADMTNAEEAVAYMKQVHAILRFADVCDGNMEEGNFRCDVNVSVCKESAKEWGTRVELKNINSFRFVARALHYEIQRQIDLIEDGGKVVQETRLFNAEAGETYTMRKKEDAHDYRYFPDPDLPPVHIPANFVKKVKDALPELPEARSARFLKDYSITESDAAMLCQSPALANYYEAVLKGSKLNPKNAANWIISTILREGDAESLPIAPERIREVLELLEKGVISGKIAKVVYEEMVSTGQTAFEVVKKKGLEQVSDTNVLHAEIKAVIDASPGQVAEYVAGKEKVFGFFMGQVMKRMSGKANPNLLEAELRRALDERKNRS